MNFLSSESKRKSHPTARSTTESSSELSLDQARKRPKPFLSASTLPTSRPRLNLPMSTSTPSTLFSLNARSSGSQNNNSAANTNGKPRKATFGSVSVAQNSQPKKLIIKSFKVKPSLPDNYFATTWLALQQAVTAIYASKPVVNSLEELYKMVENLCHHKLSEDLYSNLLHECRLRILDIKASLTSKDDDVNLDSYLKSTQNTWSSWCRQTILIRSIFLYLDRTYILTSPHLSSSLWDVCLDLFRSLVLSQISVRDRIINGILVLIKRDRDGDRIELSLIRNLIKIFIELGIYSTHMEARIIESTRDHYARFVATKIGEIENGGSGSQVAAYLLQVENYFAMEVDRCSSTGYVNGCSKRQILNVLDEICLKKNTKILLDRGFVGLVNGGQDNQGEKEDLNRMYRVFARVGDLPMLRQTFSEYVKTHGAELVVHPERDLDMVKDLLNFYSKLLAIITSSFESSSDFITTLRDSFGAFVNRRTNVPARLIAKHIDGLLKQTKISDVEVEEQLDKCLTLFRFVQGKDVFEGFYKDALAKRLLLGKSANLDSEKSMLLKLKAECGPEFTGKLEKMFKDMEVSKDLMTAFKDTAHFGDLPFEMSVNILESASWPTYPVTELDIPFELIACMERYQGFYLSKHNGRKLAWIHSLGNCILKSQFRGKKTATKELSVSLFQSLVLLLFNEHKTLTFADIGRYTKLEKKELQRTMLSLACGKNETRVLTKTGKKNQLNDDDVFEVNDGFENPKFKIRINAVQLKETKEEEERTEEKIVEVRIFAIDAAIVRIMKMRKSLKHTALFGEVVEQVRFKLTVSDFKKRIEELIDKEYIRRDESDASTFHYIA